MRLLNEIKLLIINEIIKSQYKTMPSYCLNCRKNTKNMNPTVSESCNGKTMLLSKCAMCDSEKSKVIKNKKQVEY